MGKVNLKKWPLGADSSRNMICWAGLLGEDLKVPPSPGALLPLAAPRRDVKYIAVSRRFPWPSEGKLPGVTILKTNTYPGPKPWAVQNNNLWLWVTLRVTPPRHFSWSCPFPLFMWKKYGFVQTFKTVWDEKDRVTSEKAHTSMLFGKLHWSLFWLQISLFFCHKFV